MNSIFAQMDLVVLLLIWITTLFAAVVRAFTGFGFALAAVPILSLFLSPADAVVLSSALVLAISLKNLRSFWGVVALRPLWPLGLAGLIGTVLGTCLLASISTQQFRLGAGIIVIAACALLSLHQPQIRPSGSWLPASCGLAAGVMNGVLAMPGPALIIYTLLVESEPARARALLMTFLLFAAALALASYTAGGMVHAQVLGYSLLGFPAMVLGDWLGTRLFVHYGAALYRRIAVFVLLLTGISSMLAALG